MKLAGPNALRMLAAVTVGTLAGSTMVVEASRALSSMSSPGLSAVAIIATWVVGVMGTIAGTAGAAYFGVALIEFRCRVRGAP